MDIKKCFICDKQPAVFMTGCITPGVSADDEVFVKCTCGLRGKSFLGSEGNSVARAIMWWNQFVDDYYDGYVEPGSRPRTVL